MSIALTAIPYILALVMLGGGVANTTGSKVIRASYARWGYPSGFHLVTGFLELTAAGLLLYPPLRLYGMILMLAILLAALATLLLFREFSHVPPAIIFILLIATWSFGAPAL